MVQRKKRSRKIKKNPRAKKIRTRKTMKRHLPKKRKNKKKFSGGSWMMGGGNNLVPRGGGWAYS